VRTRGILGGIVSLALVAAPGAMAQDPAPEPDPASQAETAPQPEAATGSDAAPQPSAEQAERGGRAPAKARIKIGLKGINDGKVDVGERFKAAGTVGPFVPDQKILLLVKRDGKTIKRIVKPVERGGKDGNIGRFEIRSPRVLKPGDYRVRANKLPTPQQERALRASRGVEVDYPDLDPGDHGGKVKLLSELLKKKGYYTDGDKSYDSATGRAILAFRKTNNMSRTQNATPGIFQKLAAGKGGFNVKWEGGGKHVEADLSRQVMALIKNGKAKHIFHISSGTAATPTIRGKFPTYRKDYGTNSLGMVHSVYFIRGYATHGYHSVPTYPASHGCLRNPIPNAKFIFDWIDIGDVFYVYG
jgi:hypothetical protein